MDLLDRASDATVWVDSAKYIERGLLRERENYASSPSSLFFIRDRRVPSFVADVKAKNRSRSLFPLSFLSLSLPPLSFLFLLSPFYFSLSLSLSFFRFGDTWGFPTRERITRAKKSKCLIRVELFKFPRAKFHRKGRSVQIQVTFLTCVKRIPCFKLSKEYSRWKLKSESKRDVIMTLNAY